MIIIEDTRQKIGKHITKNEYWQQEGHHVLRCRLPFGDYCTAPTVAVDTKENMSEIANNMCGVREEHIRFREECKLAKENGCHLYFLIENEEGITSISDVKEWKNPRRFIAPKAVDGKRLAKAMATMQERYGCTFEFCTPRESGQRVIDLIERG